MRELKIGIVGAGWMGKVHAMSYRTARSALGRSRRCRCGRLADLNQPMADRAAQECGIERASPTGGAIMKDKAIDIVDICTPNDMHFEVAIAALAARKHVYCEKPLANTVDLARQMAEAAQRASLTTLVGFNYIQNPVHQLAAPPSRAATSASSNYVRLVFDSDFMSGPHAAAHLAQRHRARRQRRDRRHRRHRLSYYYHLVDREIEEVLCDL